MFFTCIRDKYPEVFSQNSQNITRNKGARDIWRLLRNHEPVFFFHLTETATCVCVCVCVCLKEYLTIIPRARVGYEMIDSQRRG